MPRFEIQGRPPLLIDNKTGSNIVLSNHTEMTIARLVVEVTQQQEKNEEKVDQLLTRLNMIEEELKCPVCGNLRPAREDCCG